MYTDFQMKRFSFLLLTYIFSFCLLQAQSDFRSGYVIKVPGDTLFGEVDYRGDKRMGKSCTFRVSKNDTTIRFTPDEIVGYRFKDSKYFVSKTVNEKKVFLEYLIHGKLDIYYLRDDTTDHYYIEKEDVSLRELPYQEVLEENNEDGKLYYKKKTKYIGLLHYYLRDAPKLQSKIDGLRTLYHDNLISIAEDYHKAVCDGEKCIIYEKKLPKFKADLEIVGGYTTGLYGYREPKTNKIIAGVLTNLSIPYLSEKIYIKTGLLLSTYKYILDYQFNQVDKLIFKIPIQAEYIYI